MKVSWLITSLIISTEASENLIMKDVELVDMKIEKLAYYKRLCNSIVKDQVGRKSKVRLATLNLYGDWDILMQLKTCRTMISNNADTLFHDKKTLLGLLILGESVWESFTDLRISRLIYERIWALELEPSDKLVEFMIFFLNHCGYKQLSLFLTDMGVEGRKSQFLKQMESNFVNGNFPKSASLRHYVFFFKECAQRQLITMDTYINLIKSILNETLNALPIKFNFLVKRIFGWKEFVVPIECAGEFRKIMMISGLDGRDKVKRWWVKDLELVENHTDVIIDLHLTLPKVIVDYSIPKYIANAALNGHGDERIKDNPSYALFYNSAKKFIKLAGEGECLEARQYLERLESEIDDDERKTILIDSLMAFVPQIFTQDEIEQHQIKQHMLDFVQLSSLSAGKIELWSTKHDMSKRLTTWFQIKECHQLIRVFGNFLIRNRQTVLSLVEMGQSIWKYLDEFDLLPIIRFQILNYESKSYEPRLDISSDYITKFAMHFLNQLPSILVQSLHTSPFQKRILYLEKIAYNLRNGNFTPQASLRGHLDFFPKAFNAGLIASASIIEFYKSIILELHLGPALNSNYLVAEMGGTPPTLIDAGLENNFEWEASGLQEIFGLHLRRFMSHSTLFEPFYLNLQYEIDPVEFDLRLPHIFHHEKFIRYVLSFLLFNKFQDFKGTDSQLLFVSLEIVIQEFLDLARTINSLDPHTDSDLASDYLHHTLSFLNDTVLANNVYEALWSLVPSEWRPPNCPADVMTADNK